MWIIVLKHQKYWLFRSVIHRHNDESDKCHKWHNNTISAILNARKKEYVVMEIKYTEEELNSIDKSLLIKMFLNLQNQMETLTVETKALNDKMQKMM